MKIETKKLLLDVASACRSVEEFTTDRSFEDYDASDLVRSAVERKFEIVGEALARLRTSDPPTFDRIEDAAPVVGLRNRIIHGYNAVNHRIVWDIVKNDLPRLKAQVERLMDE